MSMTHDPVIPAAVTGNALTQLRLQTPQTLAEHVKRLGKQEWLISDLLLAESFNVMVGDSGIGKTPLLLQLGLAVAAGKPWLGLSTQGPAPVLYLNGEMHPSQLSAQLRTLSTYLGLQHVPETFYIHTPDSAHASTLSPSDASLWREQVATSRAALVIVDPMRVFFPETEVDQLKFEEMRKWARSLNTCVLVAHHRRKHDKEHGAADLAGHPQDWLQETAGLGQIINLTDTRLGIEGAGYTAGVDLTVGGFVRGHGPIAPLFLSRVVGDMGQALGYTMPSSPDQLSPRAQAVYAKLPVVFRYKDVTQLLGMGGAATTKLVNELLRARLIEKVGGQYRKVQGRA